MNTIVKIIITLISIVLLLVTFASANYSEPTPRPFEVNTDHDIWYAKNASSYITPNNELVKEIASRLFVDIDGRIKYKDIMIPWLSDEDGNVLLYTNKPFVNDYNYSIYNETYNITNKNNLPWLMPDFYLYHGNHGVCSAWANTITSLMLSGEMSIKDNNTFINGTIPAKTILGYTSSGGRDAWSEYQAYNKTWITTTMMLKIQNIDMPGMTWEEKGSSNMRSVYEFNDTIFNAIIR